MVSRLLIAEPVRCSLDHQHHKHAVFMVFSCSPSPHTTSVDPLGINFDIMNKISVSPLGSHENDNMANVLNSHSPNLEMSIGEVTVASAVASEKARVRQQSAMLDKWLMANGGNLYPCREDKEKLAAQMKMTYLQVNRWFANRRRKQTKRSKVVPSPASVTPATVNQESTSRPNTPVSKENVMTQLTPDVISAFAQVSGLQILSSVFIFLSILFLIDDQFASMIAFPTAVQRVESMLKIHPPDVQCQMVDHSKALQN
ncbi:unnamed protein product [Nippostrongylus brasiliensis]|uniref:Homeobox domain-containing protein n=1 Tax=Nippostrongylus brasiliensis TaxID=27835 RepID=A0A0N4Y3V3_NIPBR|nr:unnamed protein product [Nippostrongylus brasiliensis]